MSNEGQDVDLKMRALAERETELLNAARALAKADVQGSYLLANEAKTRVRRAELEVCRKSVAYVEALRAITAGDPS